MTTPKKVRFPSQPIGEWTALRSFTAPGLFAYRHMQADDLLHFPDFGDGDMTREQRRDALDQFVVLKRPLTAIVVFLNIVALEDFIRDIGIRISNVENLNKYFPQINKLRSIRQKENPDKPSKQLDKDPTHLMDFLKLNELYLTCIGVEPINKSDISRLYDLTIIRHCVAHNGSIIRDVDKPRFQYYEVEANNVINPPVDFVKETCAFLYKSGRHFEESIRTKLFKQVIRDLDANWRDTRPKILCDLIEIFDYFGHLPPPISVWPKAENERNEIIDRNLEYLMTMSFDELKAMSI